jgi:hypothetical protein
MLHYFNADYSFESGNLKASTMNPRGMGWRLHQLGNQRACKFWDTTGVFHSGSVITGMQL